MLIVANWKAYVEDLARAKKLVALGKKLARADKVSVVLAPPAPLLSVLSIGSKTGVAFAAQDVSATAGGAHTGEGTAQAFAAAGATYALVGHSERRAAGDTDAVVAEKLARALAQDLVPVLCVGEKERDGEGRYLARIREEIVTALEPLELRERARVIIAYEPLWAIGKDASAAISANDLAEMTLYIRKVLAELLSGRNAGRTTVLYGGAVEPENIRDLAADAGVDGFLIGHASADPAVFAAFAKNLAA